MPQKLLGILRARQQISPDASDKECRQFVYREFFQFLSVSNVVTKRMTITTQSLCYTYVMGKKPDGGGTTSDIYMPADSSSTAELVQLGKDLFFENRGLELLGLNDNPSSEMTFFTDQRAAGKQGTGAVRVEW